jgi:hypothetical protein
MAAAGAVCLQEFGLYEDFRILRSMDHVINDIAKDMPDKKGEAPFDAYTLYYVAQGLYQVGGTRWRENYPKVRDACVRTQRTSADPWEDGSWEGGRVGGRPGRMFGTAVCVFVLSIPNRYLPILQQGKAEPKDVDGRRSEAGPGRGPAARPVVGLALHRDLKPALKPAGNLEQAWAPDSSGIGATPGAATVRAWGREALHEASEEASPR